MSLPVSKCRRAVRCTSTAAGILLFGASAVALAKNGQGGGNKQPPPPPPAPLPPVIDLTTDSAGQGNGAWFVRNYNQPTGTGKIDPFLRIQGSNGSKSGGVESGFNTDARPVSMDTKDDNHWTHSITLNDVRLVQYEGDWYREFLLDANEQGNPNGRLLSLESVQIYLASSSVLNSYPDLGTKVYDLDAGSQGDMSVLMDYRLNHGSGSGDMALLVPEKLFENITVAAPPGQLSSKKSGDISRPYEPANPFVYVYSSFKCSDAGFEEWYTVGSSPAHVVPLPLAAWTSLGTIALIAAIRYARRRVGATHRSLR